MWAEPRRVTDQGAQEIWDLFATVSVIHLSNPADPDDDAGNLIMDWHNRVAGFLSTCHPSQLPRFKDWFAEFMFAEIAQLEARQDYHVLPLLTKRAAQIKNEISANGSLCFYITACVFGLLGTETRMLVGVQDNQLVFKDTSAVRESEVLSHLGALTILNDMGMRYIGEDDLWLVPDFRRLDQQALRADVRGEHWQAASRLIEDAFYRQRFTIEPRGVEVKITGHDLVTGIALKVRTALGHNSLMDIIARVDTHHGAILTVLHEERFLNSSEDPTIGSDITLLISQIYHDLVTATSIPTVTKQQANNPAHAPSMPLRGGGRWTVIPRRTRGSSGTGRVRRVIPNAEVGVPKRVSGHKRRANMRPEHRLAVEEFERQYGVEILRFLQPGETYVRPHFVPATTPDEFAELPRFIRYRAQQALEKSLRSLSPEE